MYLTQWYLGDDGQWVQNASFGLGGNGGPAGSVSTLTDSEGRYSFEGLAPYVQMKDGAPVDQTVRGDDDFRLASYRVSVQGPEGDEVVTRFHAGSDSSKDSDAVVTADGTPLPLYQQYEDARADGAVIVAHPVADGDAPAVYAADYAGVSYDPVRAEERVFGGDAGFTDREPAFVSGRIWDDADRDGVQDDPADEPGVAG